MTDETDDPRRDAGQRHRDRQAKKSREQTEAAAEIGPIPPVKNPKRRAACQFDLFRFLVTYFPHSTGLKPFSDDHRRVIGRNEHCLLHGGRNVNAVYRGFAKTTIAENSSIWGTAYGHRRYIPIFGADKEAAGQIIDSIRMELETNELLLEDFPEICFPIRALEGKTQRCQSQTCEGELTHIVWTGDTIVLPTVAGSVASGAIIRAKGLLCGSRGMKYKRPDGTNQRPDFVFIDDFQTDESAGSPEQVTKRVSTIKKSILKCAGHNKTLAVVCNATVIEENDGVEQLLNPKLNPAWSGERIPMIRAWANRHEDLWLGKYAALRNGFDPEKPGAQQAAWKKATSFYRRNRKAMDAGCVVSWVHCFDPETEISAIQHAYNMLIDDGPDVFASECQNQPPRRAGSAGAGELLAPAAINAKRNGLVRFAVPLSAEFLTAFVDIQKHLLWWIVCGWARDFTGAVLGYGAFPDQGRLYFSKADAKVTLAGRYPGLSVEARYLAALRDLTDELDGRTWRREDNARMKIDRVLYDANYYESTDAVYEFCRRSNRPGLIPSHGIGVGAKKNPWSTLKQQAGEIAGDHWRIPSAAGKRACQHVLIDVNYWKSFVHKRLLVPYGDRGSLSLFGTPADGPDLHAMIADHLHAERPVEVSARDRTVTEWDPKPGDPDNDLFDGLVGCAAGASMCGAALKGFTATKAVTGPKPMVRISELGGRNERAAKAAGADLGADRQKREGAEVPRLRLRSLQRS